MKPYNEISKYGVDNFYPELSAAFPTSKPHENFYQSNIYTLVTLWAVSYINYTRTNDEAS